MRFALPITLFVALLSFGCQGTFGDNAHGHHDDGDVSETPVPACPVDPDCSIGGDCSLYECPDYWLCEDLSTGGKRCTNPGPDHPDDGDWVCEEVGRSVVCRGSSYPDDGGGGDWNCERLNDVEVVCTDDTPGYPDDHGDGPWNCFFEGEFRVCESGDTPGDGGGWFCYDTPRGRECRQRDPSYPDDGREWDCHDNEDGETVCSAPGDLPDDGGGGDYDCEDLGDLVVCTDDSPDYPDEGGDTPTDCYFADEFRICGPGGPPDGGDYECVAGQQRWCDDAIYCSWGKQTCLPDGSWGPCIEPTVTRTGLTDRPATECGCRYFYFNDDCCEDQADRDGDGNPDCIIPEAHTAPACDSDGSLCSYCDTAVNCGGAADVCLFARDGYAFCARDCSDTGCPTGYECTRITTRAGPSQQCVPTSGTCG